MNPSHARKARRPLSASAGIGLRFPHLADFEATQPNLDWVELHTENLIDLSPALVQRLEAVRSRYQFSLHGVGLSLGSAEGLDPRHLARVKAEVERYQPAFVSEHLSWNRADGISLPDLLPLPFTEEALAVSAANVVRAQDALGQSIAIENSSAYARWKASDMLEWEFLRELVQRTGCGLLVDINNLYVNQLNLGEDPVRFLSGVPASAVVEVHLAGPSEVGGSWIDTHATPVPEPVWQLYEQAINRWGPRATVVEWDQDLPALSELVAQAERARRLLKHWGAGDD